MRFGVIGLGSIGERHVRNIRTLFPSAHIDVLTQRTTWSDRKKERLSNDQKNFFSQKHDIYIIANETSAHATTILKCLARKPKGVFVEKPLSQTSRDISRLRSALKKQRTVFFVGYCLQFYKPLLTIKHLLDSKKIGKPLSMRVSVGSDLRSWRKGDYRKNYSADKKRGGGVVLDLIHELNYPAWLLNDELRLVAGYTDTVALPINAEDVAESIFVSKRGTIVSVHQDYFRNPSGRSCHITGTQGEIAWTSGKSVTLTTKKGAKKIAVGEDRNVMYKKELAWFIDHVTKGKRLSNFEEAARDLKSADALKQL